MGCDGQPATVHGEVGSAAAGSGPTKSLTGAWAQIAVIWAAVSCADSAFPPRRHSPPLCESPTAAHACPLCWANIWQTSHQLYFWSGCAGSFAELRMVVFRAPQNWSSLTAHPRGQVPWVQLWMNVRSAGPARTMSSSLASPLWTEDATTSPFEVVQKSPSPGSFPP